MPTLTRYNSFDMLLKLLKRDNPKAKDFTADNIRFAKIKTFTDENELAIQKTECVIDPIPGKGWKDQTPLTYRRLDIGVIFKDVVEALNVPDAVSTLDFLEHFEERTGIILRTDEVYDDPVVPPKPGETPKHTIRIRHTTSEAWINSITFIIGETPNIGIDLATVIINRTLDGLKYEPIVVGAKSSAEFYSMEIDCSAIRDYLESIKDEDDLDLNELVVELNKVFPDTWVVSDTPQAFNLNKATLNHIGAFSDEVPNTNILFDYMIGLTLDNASCTNLTGSLNVYWS